MTNDGWRMTKWASIAALLCAFVLCSSEIFAAEPAKTPVPKMEPIFAICFPKKQAKELAPLAKRIAEIVKVSVSEATGSPSCCLWLEIGGVTAVDSNPGYVIVHAWEGSVIHATNVEQMTAAVDRLIGEKKELNGQIVFPRGVMTNLPVNAK